MQHFEVGPLVGDEIGATRLLESINRVAALLDLLAQYVHNRRIVEGASGCGSTHFFGGRFAFGVFHMGGDGGIAYRRQQGADGGLTRFVAAANRGVKVGSQLFFEGHGGYSLWIILSPQLGLGRNPALRKC